MKLCALDPLIYPREEMLHSDFIEDFCDLIANSIQPPYAVSVDGLWGTGKTTVMKTLEKELRVLEYPAFWFNPWEYRQSDNVVLAFLRCLAAAHRDVLHEISASGKTIFHVLLETGMDVSLKILTKGMVSLKDITGSFKTVEDKQALSFEKYDDLVETIKKEFVALINRISEKHENKPVIIFFDDLDRCLPDDTIQLLEALKNLFVTPKCKAIFVCGIDTHIAKQFIREHYHGIEDTFAINYFRKIFNLTISMPQNSDITSLLLQHIQQSEVSKLLDQENANLLARMVSTRGLQIQLSSVRKYLNVVTNFCIFLKFNRKYQFNPQDFEPEDDFILNLLMLKEAWQPLYESLTRESLRQLSCNMGELIQSVIAQQPLSLGQKEFLSDYLGNTSPFADQYLSEWLARYPTLV